MRKTKDILNQLVGTAQNEGVEGVCEFVKTLTPEEQTSIQSEVADCPACHRPTVLLRGCCTRCGATKLNGAILKEFVAKPTDEPQVQELIHHLSDLMPDTVVSEVDCLLQEINAMSARYSVEAYMTGIMVFIMRSEHKVKGALEKILKAEGEI